ncbi:MAG: diguanylate cyclase [Pseudomonadota bacterium]
MKILVVDDSVTYRTALVRILRSFGHPRVESLNSGSALLELLQASKRNVEVPDVDLILMDIMMPDPDGIETTRQLKKAPHLIDIPVIMITAQNEEASLEQAFEAGAIDYINKPVNQVVLRARVKAVLRLKEEMDRRKQREQKLKETTERLQEANRQLRQLSDQDGLTGIANRRMFDQAFLREWRRALRAEQPIALLMIDVDFFKFYNDTYGHTQGDSCLRCVANIIANSLSRPADLAARYGGEEFVALLPETDIEGAQQVANKIHLALAAKAIPHEASKVTDRVTLSIGIACTYPEQEKNETKLIETADRALYAAKHSGRNQTQMALA